MKSAMASADPSSGYRPNRRGIPARNKLIVAAIAVNLAGMIAAVYIANQIRAIPATDSAESALMIGYWTALCVVAIADALLIDELLFRGAFRLTHIQGKDPKYARASDDPAMIAATMQRSTLSFPVVLLISGGITYFLFNFVNHDFNPYYRRVGVHVSALRGDDPESQPRRLEAIAALSVRRHPAILPTLREQLTRGGEVGAWAAWSLGRFTDQKSERRAIVADLNEAARSPDPTLRREALISLSRHQDRSIADALLGEIERDLQANTFDVRLLIAAGYIQVPKLVPALAQVLQRGDERAQRVAAWAIAQHRDLREAKDLDRLLFDRLPSASLPVRCAIVHSLWILGMESANVPLVHAWETATQAERETSCSFEVVYLRPDGKEDHYELFLPVDTYQNKILHVMGQVRATAPEIRAQVEPFLEQIIAENTGNGTLLAERAQSLLDGIRTARDDSKKPGL
jgi:hypothetical protein